jgi:hemolysin D
MTVVNLAKRRSQPAGGRRRSRSSRNFNRTPLRSRKVHRLGRTRIALYTVAGLIVAAVIWASLSTVDQIVTAQGKLVASQPKLVVQPLETSVIQEDRGRGGRCRKARGLALTTLDPTFPKADVDAPRIGAFDAAIERLKAELDERDFIPSDPANPEDAVQLRLFRQRKGYYEASLGNYDAQIASLQAERQTNEAEGVLTARRLTPCARSRRCVRS